MVRYTRMVQLFIVCLALATGCAFGGGKSQAPANAESSGLSGEAGAQQEHNRAEQVMRALAAAYPSRIENVEYRNDDWAVLLGDNWYYYASGRLLPEELLDRVDDFTSQRFYDYYSKELPSLRGASAGQSFRSRDFTAGRSGGLRQRSQHFFDALWQMGSSDEASRAVRSVVFLGMTVSVHPITLEDLSAVEEKILAAARTDPLVQSWVNSIGTMHGWNWRNIAGTQSRSSHSYGVAIDILPASLGGKETYWQWAAQRGKEWWNIPYEDRYHPPDAVIKAFESHGFIWGGKWPFFDTMHFEYRPEVFILSGFELESRRE